MTEVFEFEQTQFESLFNKTKTDAGKAERRFKLFVSIAYVLKAVAIFGAIAISAGLTERVAQGVGVLIMLAVGVDALLSNQKRVIAHSITSISYRNLLEAIMFKHTNALSEQLPKKKTNEAAFFESMTAKLKELRKELFQGRNEIQQALEKAELLTLETLTVESKES